MDPNANLDQQAEQLGIISLTARRRPNAYNRRRLEELRMELLEWMHKGGFEPDWAANPDATNAFNRWRVRRLGY